MAIAGITHLEKAQVQVDQHLSYDKHFCLCNLAHNIVLI